MSATSPDTEFNDQAFLDAMRGGDREAIGRVVHAYLPQIVRAARGAGLSDETADDVAQQVFLTFIETLPRFEGRSRVRTWIFGILYHKIREMRRAVQKDARQDSIDDVVESRFDTDGSWQRPPRDTDRDLWDAEIRRHLEECLETVPEKQRLAFVLREVEGLTTREIRKILEVTDTNLGVILYRARNKLRECLENRGVAGT